jgi:hypothetical protein
VTPLGLEHAASDFVKTVRRQGVGVLRGVFAQSVIHEARQTVLENLCLMKNTRPTPSSRHLAGFHRFPQLEPLHTLISCNSLIQSHMHQLCGEGMRTIGLSDITINRSQPWHKDLLRGKYRPYLDGDDVCAKANGSVFKVFLYLQNSSSLQFVEGSHKQDVPLTSDDYAVPEDGSSVQRLSTGPGDVVVMDVCTTHRGADEEAFQSKQAVEEKSILVSTVFGAAGRELTDQMEIGNAARLADWTQRYA